LQQVFKIKNDAMKKLVLFVGIGAIVFGSLAIKKSTPWISATAICPRLLLQIAMCVGLLLLLILPV
jgi:hypothetical protein